MDISLIHQMLHGVIRFEYFIHCCVFKFPRILTNAVLTKFYPDLKLLFSTLAYPT